MMLTSLIRQIRRSIFFKLLLIFFISGSLILLSVIATAHYFSDPERVMHGTFQKNIAQYANYLIAEIGSPPDTEIATRLARELSIGIKITSTQSEWQSGDVLLPGADKMFVHILESNPEIRVGHFPGHSFVSVSKAPYDYLFLITHKKFIENIWRFLAVLLLMVVALVASSYVLVRWLLRPLRWLNLGVNQIAAGNFTYRIPERKHDELGDLAKAFNDMSSQVSQIMASKEQLLLDVSHELRSPITRVKLALEFVNDSQHKQSITNDIKEIETMITELLESARLSNNKHTLNKTTFTLKALLDRLLGQYAHCQPGIRLLQMPETIVINADEERLYIVLRNLVENALKYSATQTKPVELTVQDGLTEIKILVRDFGEGIPPANLPHVFEPFYRVDKSRHANTGGYGLGLSLCEKIISAHDGSIIVASTPGVETVFSVCLPK